MYSLRRRLLFSAIGLIIVFFGVLGVVLTAAFKDTVLSNSEDALRNQILLLMADIELEEGEIVLPSRVAEPRLSQADSSLYAQISRPDAGIVWRSDSLLDAQLPIIQSGLGEFRFIDQSSHSNARLQMSFGVSWETDQGDVPFIIHVAELADPYLKRIRRYERALWLWLGALGSALVMLLLAVLAWVLNPLRKVSKQVGEIEQGQRQRFDEDYPREVSQLTQNLNQLLTFEEQRIVRHKEVLGNLAHSLKTPIAVLSGLDYAQKNKTQVDGQLDTMRNIIEYQLQSASAVGRRRFAKPILIAEQSRKVISSLAKLYKDKQIEIVSDIPNDLLFYGDKGDWMELLGNLLDNACKWAHTKIDLRLSAVSFEGQQSSRTGILLIVEDDGPGIDTQVKKTILERGVRLDSQTPGHGLGLHIVKGIVEAYDGEIEIEQLDKGTRFTVSLR